MDIFFDDKEKQIVFNHFGYNAIFKIPTQRLTDPSTTYPNIDVAYLDINYLTALKGFLEGAIIDKVRSLKNHGRRTYLCESCQRMFVADGEECFCGAIHSVKGE